MKSRTLFVPDFSNVWAFKEPHTINYEGQTLVFSGIRVMSRKRAILKAKKLHYKGFKVKVFNMRIAGRIVFGFFSGEDIGWVIYTDKDVKTTVVSTERKTKTSKRANQKTGRFLGFIERVPK